MRRMGLNAAFFALAAMSLLEATASAADLGPRQPQPPAPSAADSWSGFYIGVGGGRSALNNRISAGPGDPALGILASLNGLGADGWMATINAGFDYQFNPSFVVGAFADYDFHTLKSSLNVNIAAVPIDARGEIKVDRQWSLGVRAGYLATPGTLLFVSGGYTSLGLRDFTARAVGPFPDMNLVAPVSDISGGFVGAGFETKLTSSISLKGEYRYMSFGSGQVTLPTVDGVNLNDFVSVRVSPRLQTVKASLNYRF